MSNRSTFREYLEALIIAGIFLGFTNTFVVKTFFIPSASMEETLLIGDHLFVNRFIFGATASSVEDKVLPLRDVRRGDIVIFRQWLAGDPSNDFIDIVRLQTVARRLDGQVFPPDGMTFRQVAGGHQLLAHLDDGLHFAVVGPFDAIAYRDI